jgi:hypothetical protein
MQKVKWTIQWAWSHWRSCLECVKRKVARTLNSFDVSFATSKVKDTKEIARSLFKVYFGFKLCQVHSYICFWDGVQWVGTRIFSYNLYVSIAGKASSIAFPIPTLKVCSDATRPCSVLQRGWNWIRNAHKIPWQLPFPPIPCWDTPTPKEFHIWGTCATMSRKWWTLF